MELVVVQEVLAHYDFEESIDSIEPFGHGHINDTFRLKTASKGFILQRINHHIFTNVGVLSSTMLHLDDTFHGKEKWNIAIPKLKKSTAQEALVAVNDSYWRIYSFCEGTRAYDVVPRTPMLESAGQAFGSFIEAISTVEPFEVILPGFHDLELRMKQLDAVVSSKPHLDRILETSMLVESAQAHLESLRSLMEAFDSMPKRNLHNDTKINNLLFDYEDRAKFVVDLDTVMPGYLHFDFGDALRTVGTDTAEDGTNLDTMQLSEERTTSFTKGFLNATRSLRTSEETKSLHWAPNYMSFIMGIRFLTDYIQGDTYYKTSRAGQNLDRARNQLHLASLWADFAPRLSVIIERLEANHS